MYHSSNNQNMKVHGTWHLLVDSFAAFWDASPLWARIWTVVVGMNGKRKGILRRNTPPRLIAVSLTYEISLSKLTRIERGQQVDRNVC